MRIGKLDRKSIWNYGLEFGTRSYVTDNYAPYVKFWWFKLINPYTDGRVYERGRDYKGIWYTFSPLETIYNKTIWNQKAITIPRKYIKFARKLGFNYTVYRFCYPVKIRW